MLIDDPARPRQQPSELRNVADRVVPGIESGAPPFGDNIAERFLPLSETVEAFERAVIADAPLRRKGSLVPSAEALGVAKATLHDKIRKPAFPTQVQTEVN